MTITQLEAADKITNQNSGDGNASVDPLEKVPADFQDLARAYLALRKKRDHHARRWSYYKGEHPLVFSSERLRQVFHLTNVRFAENWCRVVVNSVADRIQLRRFAINLDDDPRPVPDPQNTPPAQGAPDTTPDDILSSIFNSANMGIESDDLHKEADITGEGYMVAWRNGNGPVELYRQPADQCHMFYDPAQPRKKHFGAKWYVEGRRRVVVLYYADRIERWRSTVEPAKLREFSAAQWTADHEGAAGASLPNPFGEVPMFHFQIGGFGESELDDAIPLQDMINKTLSDMMVTAEYQAFPMRWAITGQETTGLKSAPHGFWKFEPGDGEGQGTSVGQFAAADLSNFITTMDSMAGAMAAITSTPKHLFFGSTGDPSGEALIAMEAPLVNKAEKYTERLAVTWRELAQFVLRLVGITIDRDQIEPIFKPAETVQPLTTAIIRQTNVAAGMPLRSALRMEGMSAADIAEIDRDRGFEEMNRTLTPEQRQAQEDAAIHAAVNRLEPVIGEMVQQTSNTLFEGIVRTGFLEKLILAGQASKKPDAGAAQE